MVGDADLDAKDSHARRTDTTYGNLQRQYLDEQASPHMRFEQSAQILQQANSALSYRPIDALDKGAVVLAEMGKALPAAAADALLGFDNVHSIPVPKVLESVGIGAAIGFTAKTFLPQTGLISRLGGAALAAVFTTPLVAGAYDSYKHTANASSLTELQSAGREIGSLLGNLAVNAPLGYAAYRAGSSGADRVLASESAKGFVAEKNSFFKGVDDYLANKIDLAAEMSKNAVLGKREFSGSHGIAEEFPRISESLRNGIKGEDYKLPDFELAPGLGEGVNVAVLTGHGVEAPEFTEVVGALENAGAKVTVVAPDWMFDYQPENPGRFTLAQWLDNERVAQADVPVRTATQMMKDGKFDALYVPGGAGNTAAIRTDAGVLNLVRQSLAQNLDTWTICHGGQVFISAEALPKGTLLTGSPDIRGQDLPNAGFVVPTEPVVFDSSHKLLSGQDPHVLNQFLQAVGERLNAITAAKKGSSAG